VESRDKPHDLLRTAVTSSGDRIAALRAIRGRLGLDLRSAQEVRLQVEGTAASLAQDEAKLAQRHQRAFDRDRRGRRPLMRLDRR
jgi:hypothetical protein